MKAHFNLFFLSKKRFLFQTQKGQLIDIDEKRLKFIEAPPSTREFCLYFLFGTDFTASIITFGDCVNAKLDDVTDPLCEYDANVFVRYDKYAKIGVFQK